MKAVNMQIEHAQLYKAWDDGNGSGPLIYHSYVELARDVWSTALLTSQLMDQATLRYRGTHTYTHTPV